MSLSKSTLKQNILDIFESSLDFNNDYDEYKVSKEIVDAIFEYISDATLEVKGATATLANGSTKTASVTMKNITEQTDQLRISLESSLVASFKDKGPTDEGQIGFKIFCKGARGDTNTELFKDEIEEIVKNQNRDFVSGSDNIEDLINEIKEDYKSGFVNFLKAQTSWLKGTAGYTTIAGVVSTTDNSGGTMFDDLKEKMENILNDTSSSTEQAAKAISDSIDTFTKTMTVKSAFTKGSPPTETITSATGNIK